MQCSMRPAMSCAALVVVASCAKSPSHSPLRVWKTDPNPALQAMITRADRCDVVSERGGRADGRIVPHVLRTLQRRSELDWFRESLRALPQSGGWMHCETNGEPILVFHADSVEIARIAVIQARIMRWEGRYTSDFYLTRESSAAVIPVFAAWGCVGYDALMENHDGASNHGMEADAATPSQDKGRETE